MAYSLPNFNVPFQYRHYEGDGSWGPWIDGMGHLKGVPVAHGTAPVAGAGSASLALLLKLPARTDIRDSTTFAHADEVQIGEWNGGSCFVALVYDVAFLFPNEYRVAVLSRTNLNGSTIARPPGMGEVPSP